MIIHVYQWLTLVIYNHILRRLIGKKNAVVH